MYAAKSTSNYYYELCLYTESFVLNILRWKTYFSYQVIRLKSIISYSAQIIANAIPLFWYNMR